MMRIGLTRNEEIKMILGRVISLSEICILIIKMMNKIEKKETLDYHDELWERISGSYFKSIEKRYPTYSYVMNSSRDCKIIALPDNILDYYLETGISYQVRDIILDQIKERKDCKEKIHKIWFYQDDKALSKVTQKIMILMDMM